MVLEYLFGVMVENIMENIKMIKKIILGCFKKKIKNMKDFGKKGLKMG